MFQTKVVGKIKKHTSYIQYIYIYIYIFFRFFRNHAVSDAMLKNTVEPDGQQMAIWHMHIECWTPKAMNTHSEHIIQGWAMKREDFKTLK